MKAKKLKSKDLQKVVATMKGYKWLKNGLVSFKGYVVDISACSPDRLSIAYATLYQIHF